MLLWEGAQLADLDRGLHRARSGLPTLMVVVGESGTGKTSLLTELLLRAREFQLLPAEGRESQDTPTAYSRVGAVGCPAGREW